jgi:hypothetical protein
MKMGRLRKKAAGKTRESCGMRRTSAYAAMTKDEVQRSIRTFYEAVNEGCHKRGKYHDFSFEIRQDTLISPRNSCPL